MCSSLKVSKRFDGTCSLRLQEEEMIPIKKSPLKLVQVGLAWMIELFKTATVETTIPI
jgi:hypothetical protein